MRLHIHSPMDFVDAIEKAHPEYFEPRDSAARPLAL
jgi:hypothetical protein